MEPPERQRSQPEEPPTRPPSLSSAPRVSSQSTLRDTLLKSRHMSAALGLLEEELLFALVRSEEDGVPPGRLSPSRAPDGGVRVGHGALMAR